MVVVAAWISIQVLLGLLETRISQCKATYLVSSISIIMFYEHLATAFKLV